MSAFFKYCLLFVSIGMSVAAHSQHERDNWFFASNAGIVFYNGNAYISTLNNNILYDGTSCVSDRKTGRLLFYTNGKTVWNNNHLKMDGGDNIASLTPSQNVYPAIITPFPGNPDKYYIFFKVNGDAADRIMYAVVDMSFNNGLGKVISTGNLLANVSPGGGGLAAVNNKCMDGVWLIYSYRNANVDSFTCFEITSGGISNGVESIYSPPFPTPGASHWVKTSRAGNIIFSGGAFSGALVYTSIFNQATGKVSAHTPLPIIDNFEYSYGGEFSADGTKLYVSFVNASQTESVIVQYSGPGFSNAAIVARNTKKIFHDLLRGPDNRIYISSQDFSYLPLPDIDVIENPDANAAGFVFKPDYLTLPNGRTVNSIFPNFSNTEFPEVLTTNTQNNTIGDICLYDSAKIFMYKHPLVDSVRWDFGDAGAATDTSSRYENVHKYTDTGLKTIVANWYVCGKKYTDSQKIQVLLPPAISLGPDTVFCHKGAVTLKALSSYKNFEWGTGETTDSITVAAIGKYWVKTFNGTCKAYDTIKVDELPPILIDLGGEYAICDDDNELVELNAGKGFTRYRWTPTGDTTQWIIVKKAGDYYVVVEDFRGCKGEDGSTVKRLCDFTFYLPGAFTPNGDGLNDVFIPTYSDITDFKIELFTTWGEKVFESNDPATGWGGMYKAQMAPDGTYIWKVCYKGYHNKVFRNYNHRGIVNLLR